MVNRIGQRIAKVANKPEYIWEFAVIDEDQVNAFALPGGKSCGVYRNFEIYENRGRTCHGDGT